ALARARRTARSGRHRTLRAFHHTGARRPGRTPRPRRTSPRRRRLGSPSTPRPGRRCRSRGSRAPGNRRINGRRRVTGSGAPHPRAERPRVVSSSAEQPSARRRRPMSSIPVPDEMTHYSSRRRRDEVDELAWPVLSEHLLSLLRSGGEELHPEPGELLWDAGDPYDLYLVLAGGVLLVDRRDNRVVFVIEQGDFVGE